MELKDFLVQAKINTYASFGEGGEKVLADGGREFVYESGDLKYRDRYFGSSRFIGEEVVWQADRLIWGLNYYGRIISQKVDGRQLTQFLKKALRQVKPARPFRGPKNFLEGDWKYQDESQGTVNDFYGEEVIYFKTQKVYGLRYHGGNLSK